MAELEHNPQLIKNLALIYEGNGELQLKYATSQRELEDARKSRWSQHEMLAASSLAIAASYWSLIEARKAVATYRRAADIYRKIDHGYWMVLSLASANDNQIPAMLSAVDDTPAPNAQAIAFALVVNEMVDGDHQGRRTENLSARWRHAGNVPIGRLGIPLDHYGHCAEAMRAARSKKNLGLFMDGAANYVHRAAEVLRGASHDRFHWLRLQSTVLPAEPEAVAMTTAMSMMSYRVFRTPISEMSNLDHHGRLLVQIGDAMRNAAFGPEAGPSSSPQGGPRFAA